MGRYIREESNEFILNSGKKLVRTQFESVKDAIMSQATLLGSEILPGLSHLPLGICLPGILEALEFSAQFFWCGVTY